MRRGQVVVVLGPDGEGKSTLLKCLLGFVRPTTGDIRVLRIACRRDLAGCLPGCGAFLGYVPQTLTVQSESPLTVREVVAIGRTGIVGLFHRLTRDDWQTVDS